MSTLAEQRSRMHALLSATDDRYGISVLSDRQGGIADFYARRPWAVAADVDTVWHDGCPVIGGAIAWFVCRKWAVYDGGDHTIFVGRAFAHGVDREFGNRVALENPPVTGREHRSRIGGEGVAGPAVPPLGNQDPAALQPRDRRADRLSVNSELGQQPDQETHAQPATDLAGIEAINRHDQRTRRRWQAGIRVLVTRRHSLRMYRIAGECNTRASPGCPPANAVGDRSRLSESVALSCCTGPRLCSEAGATA
jgi:hypothetical protein